jgi:hypothetical protein
VAAGLSALALAACASVVQGNEGARCVWASVMRKLWSAFSAAAVDWCNARCSQARTSRLALLRQQVDLHWDAVHVFCTHQKTDIRQVANPK